MNKKLLLEKMAKLAVEVGINIQKDQMLVINAPVEAAELVRLITKASYAAGSGKVNINWTDAVCEKEAFIHLKEEALTNIPQFEIDKLHYVVDNNAAFLSILSPDPHAYDGVDPKKLAAYGKARGEKAMFYMEHISASNSQWSIVAYPNEAWCKVVFPDLDIQVAYDKLFEAIMKTSRVEEDTDPVLMWNKHLEKLSEHCKILNEYNFKSLTFKNSIGTDLTVGLVPNHIWGGGSEKSTTGVVFVPNIPTEEAFTMPLKTSVNGKVVSTKPLLYNGTLINDFWFVFKDGKVIDYDAKEGKETLKYLLEADEGSSYLGEVALISNDSPISNLNILFCNTLFDENASCHLALGNAYPMNVLNGTTMDKETYQKIGANISRIHVDFMFGSSDMEVIGEKEDGQKVIVFRKGNFVF